MKNIKSLVTGFAIVLLTLMHSCSVDTNEITIKNDTVVELRNQTNDLISLLGTACVPNINAGPGCNNIIFVDTVIINTHPNYPGCNFTVVFQTYLCNLWSFTDVTVGDFQILDHDCVNFSIDVNNPNNQASWSNFIIDFEVKMWDQIQVYLINKYFQDVGQYNCGEGVFFNIFFIRASCYQYASITTRGGISGITKLACGSQCCERITRVCRNYDGTLNIVTYEYDPNPWAPYPCDDPSFTIDPPMWLRPIWLSECMVTCPGE